MIVTPHKTPKVTIGSHKLHELLDAALPEIFEKSIIVVTSKIVAICEGRVAKIKDTNKKALIQQESEYYMPPEKNKYDICLTITNGMLVPTAGIDESNGNGYYVLWPKNPYASAKNIRTHLAQKHNVEDIGVIITDSKTTPMRWGTTGVALAYAGFSGLNDFVGKPDLFGRSMEVTKVNVADGLAAAAVVCMGESSEQTPLATITQAPFVAFGKDSPNLKEQKEMHIPQDIDIYGPILQSPLWKKGNKK